MKKNRQQGFTLIELIMVIVILGIVAASAVPKFANLSSDARILVLEGLVGGIRGTIAITKSVYLINPANPVILENGTEVMVTTEEPAGLPAANREGIEKALDFSGFDVKYVQPIAIFSLTDYPGASCQVLYNSNTGKTAMETSGC